MDDNTRTVLQAVITVAGTIGGVAIGSFVTWRLEHGRRQREDARRWAIDVRKVAAALVKACDELIDAGRAIWLQRPIPRDPNASFNEGYLAWTELRLLAPELHDDGRRLMDEAMALLNRAHQASEQPDFTPDSSTDRTAAEAAMAGREVAYAALLGVFLDHASAHLLK